MENIHISINKKSNSTLVYFMNTYFFRGITITTVFHDNQCFELFSLWPIWHFWLYYSDYFSSRSTSSHWKFIKKTETSKQYCNVIHLGSNWIVFKLLKIVLPFLQGRKLVSSYREPSPDIILYYIMFLFLSLTDFKKKIIHKEWKIDIWN